MSKQIKVTADGKLIGMVQNVEWSQERVHPSHNSFTCNRIRFDKLQVATAFQGFVGPANQTAPLQITVEDGDKIMTIHNAWITSSTYTYGTSDWIITDSVEMQAEDITTAVKPIMCRFCITRPTYAAHDNIVAYTTSNNSKDAILHYLGMVPKNANMSSGWRKEALAVIEGHFPELYNELEGLIVLL